MGLDVEELYREEYDNLCTYFGRRLTGDDDEAADLASTVFLRAWEKRRAYRPLPGVKAKAWLFHIARNLLIDRYRRGGVVGFVRLGNWDPFAEEEIGSDEHLGRLDAQVAVSTALGGFRMGQPWWSPDMQLAVIREKYFVGGVDREVGERLGLTEMATKQLRKRALANLKRALEEVA